MKNVLVVYGCGGHKKQADRLCHKLSITGDKITFFSITDTGGKPSWSNDHLELKEFRNKYTGKTISVFEMLSQISKVFSFLKKNKIRNVVSMGPGVCIIVCLVAKILGCVIIHFETWSKFESLTFTTKVLKHITKNAFYQNIELKKFLPNGEYVGRL
ncbi:MAG: beta-1,4-N-acetylglucosaminyltransferase [Psychromonas sp.]|jgi:beta-1,4-N-acetylglucosaminyltransferase|uniref:PssD/Cps14F family polysaccharide biosynthesis glycosyltransferase n=1 Tax=Psychromonas sp. TaxID=1884585 RepID=UPI0039E544DA